MTKRRTKKKVAKISLAEFKTWLEGVQSMQSADWHPTADQWKMIVARIDDIEEAPAPAAQAAPAPATVHNPANPAHAPGAALGAPSTTVQPATSPQRLNLPSNGGGSQLAPVASPTQANPSLTPAPAGENGGSGLMSIKAPADDKPYESSFA